MIKHKKTYNRSFIKQISNAWLLLLVILLLGSCGENRLQALPPDATILAFGDSLTEGKGVKPSQSYPAILQELTGRTVINKGISGEVSARGKARFEKVLDQTQPDLVILCHGGNDILRRKSMSEAKENIRYMIKKAQERNIDIVLVSVPEFNLMANAPAFYKELADELNIPIEEDIIGDLMTKPSMKSDNVHFNQQGYRKVAEAIAALLKDEGAL